MTDRELTFLLQKYETFEREVISPAVYSHIAPLELGWCRTDASISAGEAASLTFEAVAVGFRWGPAWTRGWFRLRAERPAETASAVIRFDPGTEALVFDGDTPWHGLDANRNAVPLPPSALSTDGQIELFVEAECMHPWGVRAFSWDTSETHQRWGSEDPGHVTLAELSTVSDDVRRLEAAFRFARQLLAEVGRDTTTGRLVQRSIDRCVRIIDDQDVRGTARAAISSLHESLSAGANAGASEVVAVGHAHIDTAWLWTLDHTRRKCQRSWSNVLRLMDQFDDFSFLCSQAAQYAMVEADAPEQFAEIQGRVRAGRWEPFGSMWVEPDCNVPSGESLIRQIELGRRYWSERFGENDGQGTAFLPDTFGFPATLPTILAACGVHTFITNKLSWNQTNLMPATSFDWIGPDGSSVLAHLTPGGDYNATNTPKELIKGESVGLAAPPAERWLQPFGFGDGGGGPTAQHIENARLAGQCPGLPRVTLSTGSAFVKALHQARAQAEQAGEAWPSWNGDLYLELHRGTFTTQRALKQLNFRAEELLREVEMFSASPACTLSPDLRSLWETVLTNQFHDILPGSSIEEVNVQARKEMEEVCTRASELAEAALEQDSAALSVWNPASTPATGVVDAGGKLVLVRSTPPATISVLSADSSFQPVRVSDRTLDNGRLRAEIDAIGEVVSLCGSDGIELAAGPMHRYRLFRDRPHMWDAWEIDPAYDEHEITIESSATTRVAQDDALRGVIRARRAIGEASSITTSYILDAESPVLRVEIEVEWNESRRLLRVDYPTTILARSATAGTQFGTIERPTHSNSSWDRARFEFPAHRFVSLGQPGQGVAVLAADIHGWSCQGATIGASLLRSPSHPDPTSDRGYHRMAVGLYPHAGDWKSSMVSQVAERFARPIRSIACQASVAPLEWETDGDAVVELASLRQDPENSDSLLARFVEVAGGSGTIQLSGPAIHSIVGTDAIGRARVDAVAPSEPISIRAGQIATFRIDRRS